MDLLNVSNTLLRKRSFCRSIFSARKLFFFIAFFTYVIFPTVLTAAQDLDRLARSFVLWQRKITVPGYPGAYNPSIVRWNNRILMSFRVLINPTNLWHSQIGVVWLDDNFNVVGTPQLLNTRVYNPHVPSRSEDARLCAVGSNLYLIYNDNEEVPDGCLRRMHVTELLYDGVTFFIGNVTRVNRFEGENGGKWEKNWIPFEYNNTMLLAYSIAPHRVFMPHLESDHCSTIGNTMTRTSWRWGELRGGTPALLQPNGEYLAFFHSSKQTASLQSYSHEAWHYFMGAYTFTKNPPFTVTQISPEPIVGKGMYSNPVIEKRVIFPGGFIFDDKSIWLVYGREDCECWVAKLKRKGLMESLVPVKSN